MHNNGVALKELIAELQNKFSTPELDRHRDIHSIFVSLSNFKGFLYELISKSLIKTKFKFDISKCGKRFLPDRKLGSSYDFVFPLNGNAKYCFWVTHLDKKMIGERLQKGNTPKNLQRNIGELLLVKKTIPRIKTSVVLFDIENFSKYAEGIYALCWDFAFIVEDAILDSNILSEIRKLKEIGDIHTIKTFFNKLIKKIRVLNIKSRIGEINKEKKNLYNKILEKEIRVSYTIPPYREFESLPSIGGYAKDDGIITSIVFNILKNPNWKRNPFIDKEILEKINKIYKLTTVKLTMKKLLEWKGLTINELLQSIEKAFKLLPDSYKLKKAYMTQNFDKLIEYLTYSKSWDLFNPLEYLLRYKLKNAGFRVKFNETGDLSVPSFLDDLKLGMYIEEDMEVVPNIFFQVKTLSTRIAGRKMAGYDVKRMSARAFFARWKVDGGDIVQRNLKHVAMLDGSWIGPYKNPHYPSKNFDFLHIIGGYNGIFLAHQWSLLFDFLENMV